MDNKSVEKASGHLLSSQQTTLKMSRVVTDELPTDRRLHPGEPFVAQSEAEDISALQSKFSIFHIP